MLSKKSFFNFGFFKKSCSRFSPLWMLYLLIWIIILPVGAGTSLRYVFFANLEEKASSFNAYVMNCVYIGGLIMGIIFGILSAMAVWSFLYSRRSCDGTACLPIGRTALFISATASGLVPFVIANLITALITIVAFANITGVIAIAGRWLLLTSLIFLFFYAMAVFIAQLTGNIIALPIVYGIFNCLAVAFEAIVKVLSSEYLFGLTFSGDFTLSFLSPPFEFARILWGTYKSHNVICHYALAAVVLLVLGCIIFGKRRMETAGDVVAFDILKPVSVILAGIGGGLGLGIILFYLLEAGRGEYSLVALGIYMCIGAFICCFAAQMAISKSFRVLRRSLPFFAITAALCFLFCLNCSVDFLGVENRVPADKNITQVEIAGVGENTILKDPENIKKVTGLHKIIIENKASMKQRTYDSYEYVENSYSVSLVYTLGSNRTFTRSYLICGPCANDIIRELQDNIINSDEAVLSRKQLSVEPIPRNIRYADIGISMTARECADASGYTDAKQYLMEVYGGFTPTEIANMSPEVYKLAFGECIANYCLNVSGKDYAGYSPETVSEVRDIAFYYPDVFESDESYITYLAESFDEDRMFFNYQVNLNSAEISSLYYDCILPDFENGLMGKLWLLREDLENNLADGYIFFEVSEEDEATGIERWESFRTFPVTGSSRTGAFLAERGIVLHPVSEINSSHIFWG